MGHFTINLPNNSYGDVRFGKVIKKTFLLNLLPWRKVNREVKTGYIVKLKSGAGNETEYRLFKADDGQWSMDADGKEGVEAKIPVAIKQAIEENERQYN